MRARFGVGRGKAAVALVAGSALLLAGCAGGSGSDSDAVHITYMTQYSGAQLEIIQGAVDEFNEQNPDIVVDIQTVPYANVLSTLRTRASAPDGPTVVDIYDMWLPELVRDGIAAPVTDEVMDDLNANYSEGAVKAATIEGVTYGYPYELASYAMLYNKRLFDEAGLDAPPTTWDETIDYAKKLTDPAKGQQGIGLITSWQNGTIHPFLSWAASNGVELMEEGSTTATNLDDPKMLEVAKFYQELVESGAVDTSLNASNAQSTGDYLQNFAAGKTAMLPMANWIEGALISSMGEETFFDEVGVAPLPVGPSGTAFSGISYSWLSVVNAKASDEKQEAAWKFQAFLNGPESGENGSSAKGDMEISMGALPARLSDLEAHNEQISTDSFMAGFAELTPLATPFPTVLGGLAASDHLALEIEAIIFGQKSADEALAAAKEAVEADFEQANG